MTSFHSLTNDYFIKFGHVCCLQPSDRYTDPGLVAEKLTNFLSHLFKQADKISRPEFTQDSCVPWSSYTVSLEI